MRVCAKSTTSGDCIVIQDAKRTKVHSLGVLPIREAKAVVGVEPSVIGVTP